MWHLLTAHQQESFLPLSSRQSLSCFLSHVAKGNNPRPCGPDSHPSCGVLSYSAKTVWSSLRMAATPAFKSQHQSSSAAPFPTPPTISYTCQHSRILPALLGCHSKSGQVWPHGIEPAFSKLSHRLCNQGELPPSYILGESHSHPPCSKHGHSCLTYL